MNQYEVTIIVDPVLSGDEIKGTAQTYVDHLKGEGCEIVHVDEMGLKQLAYQINRRSSGVYFCIEFKAESGAFIDPLELALRRDERIMRFLVVRLDKYGVKYNEDKRNGLIGKKKKSAPAKEDDRRKGDRRKGSQGRGQQSQGKGQSYKGKPEPNVAAATAARTTHTDTTAPDASDEEE